MRLIVVLALALTGCSIDETHAETIVLPARPKTETFTCSSPFTTPDLSNLTKCGDAQRGAGHCFDTTKVGMSKSELSPCEGEEHCVPDSVLVAAGKKAKGCTFFVDGKPGACVSMLAKRVFENKDLLKQDTCAPDERCVPCVDPRNGKETALCAEQGAHELACTGGPGAKATSCCHRMGECILPDAVPEDARATMIADTCKGGKLCAPISQLDAKPVHCEYLGASGVCLDVCFAASMKGMTSLGRGGCGPTELCMPCALANLGGGDQKLIGCE